MAGRFRKLFYPDSLSLSLLYFARVTRSLGPMDTFIASDEVSSRDGDDRPILSDSREGIPVRSSVKTVHSRHTS